MQRCFIGPWSTDLNNRRTTFLSFEIEVHSQTPNMYLGTHLTFDMFEDWQKHASQYKIHDDCLFSLKMTVTIRNSDSGWWFLGFHVDRTHRVARPLVAPIIQPSLRLKSTDGTDTRDTRLEKFVAFPGDFVAHTCIWVLKWRHPASDQGVIFPHKLHEQGSLLADSWVPPKKVDLNPD